MIAGVSMDIGACFSPDYRTARARFRDRAAHAGGKLAAYDNPLTGPAGEHLAIDIAWFGPKDAGSILVMVSATHGVEGFTGSAAELDWLWLGGPSDLPPDTAVLLVHALNPHGFAWLRRVTEEGVDLNRNLIDFDGSLPDNPGYRELADALVPAALDDATLKAAAARIAAYRAAHGERAFEAARSSGQYSHPDGIFYGGTARSWSTEAIGRIAQDYNLARRDSVAVIDFHTGLGAFGYGEPICGHRPGESGQARCRLWYGASLGEPMLGTSSSLPIAGLTQYGWAEAVGSERLTFIALEFGTFPADIGASALRDDHWLHAQGPIDWNDSVTRRIKAALRHFYHPDTQDWCELVLMRSRQIIGQALTGLAAQQSSPHEQTMSRAIQEGRMI